MLNIRCQSRRREKNEIELDQNINTNLGLELTNKQNEEVEEIDVGHCKKYIFQSRDEMSQSLSKLCYGNLYVIGSLWLEGMKKIMVGKRMCVFRTHSAANNNKSTTHEKPQCRTSVKDCIPKKPPDMSCSELPVYCSPHRDYNEYVYSTWHCPDYNCYTLQRFLCPYVREARITIQSKAKEAREQIEENICVFKLMTEDAICDLRKHMQDPHNCVKAKTCVALSTATGVVLGSKKGLLRALFYGCLAALASGSFCFPKETDVAFRNVCYVTWSMIKEGFDILGKTNNCVSGISNSPNGTPKCPEEEVTDEHKNIEQKKARKVKSKIRHHS